MMMMMILMILMMTPSVNQSITPIVALLLFPGYRHNSEAESEKS